MKKTFQTIFCTVLALALCGGAFAQQNVNPENARKNPSRANVEFTDMSFVKDAVVNTANNVPNTPPTNEGDRGVNGVGTFNIATGTGTGDGWAWNAPVLTILNASDVTVTGRADASDNHHRIIIAAGATTHLILDNASVVTGEWLSGDYEHPIFLNEGATLTLTLEGENIVTAGDYVPGISVSTGRTIIINGNGSLSATGGWQGTGIGGGLWEYGDCGTIIINGGTIYTKGAASSWVGTAGAGIGSGAAYANGDITINGGSIIAIPGNESAKGIGNGGGNELGTFTMTGNPIIFTTSVADMNPDNKTGGILVVRNATHWYGSNNHTLGYNTNVPATNLLTIEEGKTLTIPAGITMINAGVIVNHSQIIINGTLTNNGKIINVGSGTITGTVGGATPTTATPENNNINLSTASPSHVGTGWVFANNVYTVLDGAVNITGTSASSRRIEVASYADADITLNNATITGISNYLCPFLVSPQSNVNLTIEGNNILKAARTKPGLQVVEDAELTISGTGNLTVTGGEYGGSGIGAAFMENCGKVTVNKGAISATTVPSGSYHDGAGIGGGGAGIIFFSFEGMGGLGGDITINGGEVHAGTGEDSGAAGIGGGSASAEGGTLTMNGNGIAFASALETYNGTMTNITGVVNGILFDDIYGTLYGSVNLAADLEIPTSYTLTIPAGTQLKIPIGINLIVEGTVTNNGTIIKCGNIFGQINGNQPIPCGDIYTVTFSVYDSNNSAPITDAVITFDGAQLTGYQVQVEEGTYNYSVSHPNYCTVSGTQNVTEDLTINVPMTLLGISVNAAEIVALYPNPFTNEINVSNPSVVKNVTITNISGQKVQSVCFDGKTISTKELSAGIYFITLENHNGEKVTNKMLRK